ncbi:hypothetical protein ACNJX9_12500 [Bradyrhizobium sp. DASA03076]|jgi:hypothetical protein|uniref:hypothetical protein n=1 Tax=Bradyrhizobium sp. BLXBL-03 TaxID=3395916 RepID=UPI003F70C04A
MYLVRDALPRLDQFAAVNRQRPGINPEKLNGDVNADHQQELAERDARFQRSRERIQLIAGISTDNRQGAIGVMM